MTRRTRANLIVLPFVFTLFLGGTAASLFAEVSSPTSDERLPFLPLDQPEEEGEDESLEDVDPFEQLLVSSCLRQEHDGLQALRLLALSCERLACESVMKRPNSSRAPPLT